MKLTKRILLLAACSTLIGTASPLTAATYTDTTGEGTVLPSFPHIDITSVEVNNTASALSLKVNLLGNPVTTDWGKYIIVFDTKAGGDTAGNGWGRPFSMSSGMDYFVGSWADSGNGSEIRNWTGSAWNLQSATYNPNPDNLSISKDASSVTLQFNFAGLGLNIGDSFTFDVFTTGGGGSDSAIDAAANPNVTVANWGDAYAASAPNVFNYTLTAIPEPASLSLLAGGALLLLIRRRA